VKSKNDPAYGEVRIATVMTLEDFRELKLWLATRSNQRPDNPASIWRASWHRLSNKPVR
jgi:hypothetical protein